GDRAHWGSFDQAAGAADEVSLQTMRASTRNTLESYLGAAKSLLDGVRELQDLFGKPIIVSDLALSTYGGPRFLAAQAEVLAEIRLRETELAQAGVYAIVYRSVMDADRAPHGYFGEGERHFGLVWSHNKTAKPALQAWQPRSAYAQEADVGVPPRFRILALDQG
ncbi:MAG TPA: hypothetical protein VI818_02140, partial [Candidatus Thermoplasmatota archaeon]|nr:hypothetical protein [Candidatus Thermoplasmatota archaeon]